MSTVDELKAFYARNRKAVLVSAAGVVGIALYMRHRAAAGTTSTSTSSAPAATLVSPTSPQTSSYDSTAYDVYSSLQGELESLQSQIGGLSTAAPVPGQPTGATSPTPAPAAPVTVPNMVAIAAPKQNADASFTSPAQIQSRLLEVLTNRNIPTSAIPAGMLASYTQQVATGKATIDQFRTAANNYATAGGKTQFTVP